MQKKTTFHILMVQSLSNWQGRINLNIAIVVAEFNGEITKKMLDISLQKAFAEFAKTSQIPNLWIYASNDDLFPAALANTLAQTYRQNGAPLTSVMIDSFAGEGHRLFDDSQGVQRWSSAVDDFLKKIAF